MTEEMKSISRWSGNKWFSDASRPEVREAFVEVVIKAFYAEWLKFESSVGHEILGVWFSAYSEVTGKLNPTAYIRENASAERPSAHWAPLFLNDTVIWEKVFLLAATLSKADNEALLRSSWLVIEKPSFHELSVSYEP